MRMLRLSVTGRSIVLLGGVFLSAALVACGPQHRAEASVAQALRSTAAAAPAKAENGPFSVPDAPFDIQVVRAVVLDADAVPAAGTSASAGGKTDAGSGMTDPERWGKQLLLEIEINNRTDQTFEQVHYSLRLDTEPESFDVSTQLERGSAGVFRVAPQQADPRDAPDGGVTVVSGFVHRWVISIPSSSDSADACERAFSRLPDVVRSVTVDIAWDRGS